MRQQFAKIISVCKLLLLFITLTSLFYGVLLWIGEHVQQNYRYEEPKGRAVKVIQDVSQPLVSFRDVKNRLLFYYRFGE